MNSASQISVIILVLLYLAISQTAIYDSRLARIVNAQYSLAQDVVVEYVREPYKGLPNSPWASTAIQQIGDPDFQEYRVSFTEIASHKTWSVETYLLGADLGKPPHLTKDTADREGVHYEEAETALKIFPRIRTSLSAKDVALPGAGLSLDLESFALLAPFLVFGAIVILGDRVKTVRAYHTPPDEPWLLMDAQSGMVGLLAKMWLGSLAVAPFLEMIAVTAVVALSLRAGGDPVPPFWAVSATGYVIAVTTLLAVSTFSLVRELAALRIGS